MRRYFVRLQKAASLPLQLLKVLSFFDQPAGFDGPALEQFPLKN